MSFEDEAGIYRPSASVQRYFLFFVKEGSKDFYDKLTAHLVRELINFFSITEHYNIKYSDTIKSEKNK